MIKLKNFKPLVFFMAFLFPFIGNAQVIYEETMYDMGDVEQGDQLYHDFEITNASPEPIYILRADEPYGTTVKYSKKKVLPDSSAFIRIKYTPKRKGSFESEVPVWFSSNNQPINFTIKGDARYADVDASLECPDFTKGRKEAVAKQFHDLQVKVVDSATGEPVSDARVRVIWDGLSYKELNTNKRGIAEQELKMDIYYLVADAEGYKTGEKSYYVNRNNKSVTISLAPGEEKPILAEEPPEIEEEPDTIPDEVEDVEEEPEKYPEFPVDKYAPNNIVFLLDVSVSMKQEGRLDLLKASMIQLTQLLRDIDKIAIVTYASETNIPLESTSGNNKDQVINVIQALEAHGYTAGKKGIKKAYSVAKDNFIENGNNQVFIATDGAFNIESSDKAILRHVRRNARKGIQISVVGIKNERWTAKSMKAIAKEGNGNYIRIRNYKTAKEELVEEVKKKSLKQP